MLRRMIDAWTNFWRAANRIALALDADPYEPLHQRIRALEQEVGHRRSTAAAGSSGPPKRRPDVA
jgi:hypothetical protein